MLCNRSASLMSMTRMSRGHRHQHLAEVLGLRLGPAPEWEMGELAYSVDEFCDRLTEFGRDLRLGGRGVPR